MKFRDLDVGKVTVDVAGGIEDWIFLEVSVSLLENSMNTYLTWILLRELEKM